MLNRARAMTSRRTLRSSVARASPPPQSGTHPRGSRVSPRHPDPAQDRAGDHQEAEGNEVLFERTRTSSGEIVIGTRPPYLPEELCHECHANDDDRAPNDVRCVPHTHIQQHLPDDSATGTHKVPGAPLRISAARRDRSRRGCLPVRRRCRSRTRRTTGRTPPPGPPVWAPPEYCGSGRDRCPPG